MGARGWGTWWGVGAKGEAVSFWGDGMFWNQIEVVENSVCTTNTVWNVNYILMKLSLNSNNTWGRASCHTRCASHLSHKAPQNYPPGEGVGNTLGSQDQVSGWQVGSAIPSLYAVPLPNKV